VSAAAPPEASPSSNKDQDARLDGNRRVKKAPMSEGALALRGCGAILIIIIAGTLATVLFVLGWLKTGIGVTFIGLILVTAVLFFSRKIESSALACKEAEQKERDAKASEILEHVRNHHPLPRPLLLYLRPSAEEAQFSWCIGMIGTWSIGMLENKGSYAAAFARRDFEGVIAKIAEPLGNLVTVGGEKTIGGGRLESTEEEWFKSVKALCDAASVIFVLPARSDGVTKEVKLLNDQKYRRKTIFIMPAAIVEDAPAYPFLRYVTRKSLEYRITVEGRRHFLNLGVEDYWSAVRQHLLEKGVELPPFRDGGLAFSLSDHAGQVHEICTLTSYLPSSMRLQEWMMQWRRHAPRRMPDVIRYWGDDVWDDPRTTQVWPLLAHVLDLVRPL
jgi:hypothetical protein